jgi:hypothetical protein
MSEVSTPKKNTPWQFQPLPPDHLHPLTFLRPDVVLHVHDLWKSGKQNEPTYRTFCLPGDSTNVKPFRMMGGFACVDYIESWRITPVDLERLRGLESLAELSPDFWDYLISIPHFTGSVNALPDGLLMGDRPIKISPEVRVSGEAAVPLVLVAVEGPSAEVALISEAFAAILDFSLQISADQLAHQQAGLVGIYYETERELHPYWAKLAGTIESIISNDNPLERRLHKLWIWSDVTRDPDMPARTLQARRALEAKGYDTGVLARTEVIR